MYELISENGANVAQTTCPDANTKIASSNIGPGVTHNYTLKITYKNVDRNQDDNKGKTFSTKISLIESDVKYNTIANQITMFKTAGASDLEYDGVDTLGELGTPDNNLRYIGANPNNYVYYNCDTTNINEMNDSTCERWRIIGVMNNIEDENGNSASRVKIIKDEALDSDYSYYSWDSDNPALGEEYSIDQWGESTYSDGTPYEGSILKRELNTDYLGNITIGTDGKWYQGYNKYSSMPTKLLQESSINMIQDVVWNTGNASYNIGYVANTMYSAEREEHEKVTGVSDDVIRTSTWTGKVALPYPSDYVYAPSGDETTSRMDCLNSIVFVSSAACYNNNWLYRDYDSYTLTTVSNSAGGVFRFAYYGPIGTQGINFYLKVRPSLFLKNDVRIAFGNGSSANPFKLTM